VSFSEDASCSLASPALKPSRTPLCRPTSEIEIWIYSSTGLPAQLAFDAITKREKSGETGTLPELMNKFKSVRRVHGFVKAQLMAGARFSLIMLQICHPKLDMSNIVDLCHSRLRKRRRNVNKINDAVTLVAEKMIEDLLRMDAEFFTDCHYAYSMGASTEGERVNIDDLIRDD
jgi:hypothetical protein